jgi:hypothetical protein
METAISLFAVYRAAQPFQNQHGMDIGDIRHGSVEDKRFRGFFGCSAVVARKAWIMIQPLLDVARPSFTNYLGALMFMYGYPLEKQMCSLMGVTDPRTMHRRIEPYVDALFELNYEVVSSS